MAQNDHYKSLGVDKKSTPKEIKKAFRNLAVKYHPDRNSDDKTAEDKFKEINEAYTVLSDPKKKEESDSCVSSAFNRQYSQEDLFRRFDFGSGFSSGGFRSEPQKGGDLEVETDVSFRDAALGTEKVVAFSRNGTRVALKIKIPAGVDNGYKIRITGKGTQGVGGGQPGDLLLIIRTLPDPVFTRDGSDLFVEQSIPYSAACLGTSLDVPTRKATSASRYRPASSTTRRSG